MRFFLFSLRSFHLLTVDIFFEMKGFEIKHFHFSDDDSIEDKDDGSGLSTPCNLERSFRESIMDDFEEMERRFMEEDF